ncbi:hypothetical protein [Streptomyces luteoverticillatus]|uniref:hypothetical protein n=1 Tax=Streptomyces luteoverticillatus TaxID=66425 RepID=UPI0019D30151|nr:hypothetical protein [Streptomyces luteoverticillatus]
MKLAMRTGLAVAAAAATLATASPTAGATGERGDQAVAVQCRVRSVVTDTSTLANPTRIKAAAYNQARSILAKAGSDTAAKSHPVHGTGDVPVGYGTNLLACSRDEFRAKDKNAPIKRSGMTPYHYVAIHDAARTMGIDRW